MIEEIIQEILKLDYVYVRGLGQVSHDRILDKICIILQNHGFLIQKEKHVVQFERGKRGGYIDVFATRKEITIGIEFDSHKNIKWKSMQKLAILKPDISIFIVGTGKLDELNYDRMQKLKTIKNEVYFLSLEDKNYISRVS